MDLSSRLNAVESKHTHLEKANREFSTFRDQTHSWWVVVFLFLDHPPPNLVFLFEIYPSLSCQSWLSSFVKVSLSK